MSETIPRNTYPQYPQTVLSSLYPIFFGITLSNYVNYESGKILFPSLDLPIYITILLLILYYLSDWIKSVHRAGSEPEKYNTVFLLFLIVFNLFYCFMILYIIHDYILVILFIGIYSLLVPWWDLYVWKSKDNLLPSIRLGFGILYLIIGSILYIANDAKFAIENRDTLFHVLNILLFFIVVLKIFGTHLEVKKQYQEG